MALLSSLSSEIQLDGAGTPAAVEHITMGTSNTVAPAAPAAFPLRDPVEIAVRAAAFSFFDRLSSYETKTQFYGSDGTWYHTTTYKFTSGLTVSVEAMEHAPFTDGSAPATMVEGGEQ